MPCALHSCPTDFAPPSPNAQRLTRYALCVLRCHYPQGYQMLKLMPTAFDMVSRSTRQLWSILEEVQEAWVRHSASSNEHLQYRESKRTGRPGWMGVG